MKEPDRKPPSRTAAVVRLLRRLNERARRLLESAQKKPGIRKGQAHEPKGS